MSAMVCGKRSFFDDMESETTPSPSAYKKFRCSSSTSPVRFSHSRPMSPIDHLKALFPDMETQLLEKALESCGDDLDSAIKSLNEHCLAYAKCNSNSPTEQNASMENGATLNVVDADSLNECNGVEWVELFVREMKGASSIDDAKSRITNLLTSLEKTLSAAGAEATQNCHKENLMLKEQLESLLRDNVILKRAVAIQHERQREYDEKNQEVHQLKQLLTQYKQQLRALEVNNYALNLRLRQADQRNSMPGRFHPDIF